VFPCPLQLNNQMWRQIKISFHCRDGRCLGSCNYEFFWKKQFVILPLAFENIISTSDFSKSSEDFDDS
jgi:hypothetical protein